MLRWIIYRLKRWHYYLFDFCYAAQMLLLVQLWAYPTSVTLAKVSVPFLREDLWPRQVSEREAQCQLRG